jgi:hypothetical protein
MAYSVFGRSAEYLGDALGCLATPVWPDHQVEARRGAVHLAEVSEATGTCIDDLVDLESVAEIGHLDHHGRFVEGERAGIIDHV